MSIYDVFSGGNRPFDKAEWAAQKQAQRNEAYGLIDTTCAEMEVNGDAFRQYLDVQGRFDRYSVNNAILVSAQKPEATQLKDYSSWKQSRVYVDKDAQKVTILEPGKEYNRDDGSKAVSYNAKVVYDISQTSAKERHETKEPKTMRELADEGMSMLVVTHEMGFARNVSSKVMFMEDGTLVEAGSSKEFFANPKEERTKVFLRNVGESGRGEAEVLW